MHALLLTSFLFLAYTGFAIMYPGAWWVAPLNLILDTEAFRSTAHRVAGIVLTGIALQHLWFLFFNRRGKQQRRYFRPGLTDLRDLWHNVLFFIGRRKQRPRFGRFGYVEKAEYWALIWGTAVMVITGFVLWFEGLALRYIPLWLWEVFQVAHRYEAVLAALSIAIWHFYHVFVNPDESPMSLTWITGRVTHEELKVTHPAEYDEVVGDQPPGAAEAPDTPGTN